VNGGWSLAGPAGRIGLIGDLHGSWDAFDVDWFARADYDLLLFTGDLGSGTRDNGVRVARAIGRLPKPALVMLGNNDARDAPQIAAELAHQRGLVALHKLADTELSGGREANTDGKRDSQAGDVRDCGFSLHPLDLGGRAVTVLAGRPFAMGGGALSFPERLRERYRVGTMQESSARLRALVERAPSDELIVLAHNGPHGLGAAAADIWGCDFLPEAGDWGDPDLREALEHARAIGKRVLAVIAGHMHLRTKRGERRTWQLERDGTLYVNPALVPRIYGEQDATVHHHALLELDASGARVREVLVRQQP
jgi:uncharacterized protein (TIGR04168 family)